MSRYIDVDELLKKAHTQFDWNDVIDVDEIKAFPTADVSPIIHAYWERLNFPKRKRDYYRCTNCGRVHSRDYDDEQSISEMLPFCNCGAKMDVDEKE